MTTPPSTSTYLLYVGIDIAATTFTATWLRPTGTARPGTSTRMRKSIMGLSDEWSSGVGPLEWFRGLIEVRDECQNSGTQVLD